MASASKTPNLNLPQWVGTEKPERTDFNAAFDAIDTTVASHMADYANKFPDNAGAHNSIYRGKNLGTSVTAEQYNNIANGTFKDMYIGDYWTINGTEYLIAAFNYYYNAGDSALTQNHITLIPASTMYKHEMNDTNTTGGGYVGSKMYTEGLDQAKTIINSAFSGHIITYREYLSNAVSNGVATGGAWFDVDVALMNEHMVYGSNASASAVPPEGHRFNVGVSKSQLPLFRFRHDLISIRSTWWMRDVASAADFASVHNLGIANRNNASYSAGVRPAFSIS